MFLNQSCTTVSHSFKINFWHVKAKDIDVTRHYTIVIQKYAKYDLL